MLIPVQYQNPDASNGLMLSMEVVENTSAEELERHTKESSRKYQDWLAVKDEHNGTAVLIGGGDSINDHIDEIKSLGGTVFAMNGASQWAFKHGIEVDYQVILDAKQETADLVDPCAKNHLFASQCHPDTLGRAVSPVLWHLDRPGIEDLLPKDRVKKGGYVIVGGDSSVGICALCLVYTQGFRDFHVFGYDSSYRGVHSHAYHQPQNQGMPSMEIEWMGRTFVASMAMRKQPEMFLLYTTALKEMGCDFSVYGDGLLQSVYNTDYGKLTAKEKKQISTLFESYDFSG